MHHEELSLLLEELALFISSTICWELPNLEMRLFQDADQFIGCLASLC